MCVSVKKVDMFPKESFVPQTRVSAVRKAANIAVGDACLA